MGITKCTCRCNCKHDHEGSCNLKRIVLSESGTCENIEGIKKQDCSLGLAQNGEKCAGFTENRPMDRGVEFALISEAVLLILRLFMPAMKDAAANSENKIDDVLVKFLEILVK